MPELKRQNLPQKNQTRYEEERNYHMGICRLGTYGSASINGNACCSTCKGNEIFSFEYHEAWLSSNQPILYLDPNLGLYKGKQYLPEGKNNFGLFPDSAPDRWGRLLMRRREAWQAKLESREEKSLF
jgi:serine/threonine-protein kinase HipA